MQVFQYFLDSKFRIPLLFMRIYIRQKWQQLRKQRPEGFTAEDAEDRGENQYKFSFLALCDPPRAPRLFLSACRGREMQRFR